MDSKLICRTCLRKEVPHRCQSISPEKENEETSNILEMLSYCVPELDLYLIVDPVICNNCLLVLQTAFKFKTQCLKNEEKFLQFSHSVSSRVDLNYYCKVHGFNQNEFQESKEIIKIERNSSVGHQCESVNSSVGKPAKVTHKFECKKCYGCANKLKDPSYHSKNYISPYICYNCGKKLNNIMDFRKHMINHTRQRKCKICNKCFRDLYQLRTHLRIHTGVKPFVCTICSKAFRQKHNLTQHIKQHEGNNSCKLCRRNFSTKYNLKVHIQNTHLKREVCDLCGEKFYTKTALIKHLETDSPTCGKFIKTEVTTEPVHEQQIKTETEFIEDADFQCKKEVEDTEEIDIMN